MERPFERPVLDDGDENGSFRPGLRKGSGWVIAKCRNNTSVPVMQGLIMAAPRRGIVHPALCKKNPPSHFLHLGPLIFSSRSGNIEHNECMPLMLHAMVYPDCPLKPRPLDHCALCLSYLGEIITLKRCLPCPLDFFHFALKFSNLAPRDSMAGTGASIWGLSCLRMSGDASCFNCFCLFYLTTT